MKHLKNINYKNGHLKAMSIAEISQKENRAAKAELNAMNKGRTSLNDVLNESAMRQT